MERTPREVVLELYRLWKEGGDDAAGALISPDIERVEPANDGEITAMEENGDRVLVHYAQRATPRGGSIAVEAPIYNIWTVRDGLAVRMQMFYDLDEARSALYAS